MNRPVNIQRATDKILSPLVPNSSSLSSLWSYAMAGNKIFRSFPYAAEIGHIFEIKCGLRPPYCEPMAYKSVKVSLYKSMQFSKCTGKTGTDRKLVIFL